MLGAGVVCSPCASLPPPATPPAPCPPTHSNRGEYPNCYETTIGTLHCSPTTRTHPPPPTTCPALCLTRRYPNRYESIIGTLCDSLESLDEPEAKASMVWIIGEYAERIDNAGE